MGGPRYLHSALTNRHAGCHCVGSSHARHDGAIRNAEAFDSDTGAANIGMSGDLRRALACRAQFAQLADVAAESLAENCAPPGWRQ